MAHQRKAITLAFQILAIFLLCCQNPFVRAEIEKFEVDIGTGRRTGDASLTIQPNLDAKTTYVDFATRQLGVNIYNTFRVAVQRLRHSNDELRMQYESFIIELRIPEYGTTLDPALIKVIVGKPYDQYVKEGGTLGVDEYINLVLLDENQDVTTYSGALDYQVLKTRVVVGDFVGVNIESVAPKLDPIGTSKIWYKWVFYNDRPTCSDGLEHTCLGNAPIDGDVTPFKYTTYYRWQDYYKMIDFYTFMWVMYATSFMGVFGIPAQFVFGLAMQGYAFAVGYYGYTQAQAYENFDQYDNEIVNMLILSLAYFNIQSNLFILYQPFPIIAQVMDGILMYYIPTEIERLEIPIKFELADLF